MSKDKLSADVPPDLAPLFGQAQERVKKYFETRNSDNIEGKFYLGDDRHMLLRGDALSVELVNALRSVCGDDHFTQNAARALVFDIGHSLGASDARMFIKKMKLEDPIEKLAVGPIYFAYSGLGRVEILPESNPSSADDFVMRFRHKNAIEAEAWASHGVILEHPGCMLASGYSSGWGSVSFGFDLVVAEVTCVAAGDAHCEFVMAPPHMLESHTMAHPTHHDVYVPQLFGRLEHEQKMRTLAYRDSLTGLVNRTFLNEHVQKNLKHICARNGSLAIAHIDLDRFKSINDSYGHAAGDHLLVEMARRMQDSLESTDIVARVGGDEFIAILPGALDAQDLKAKIRALLRGLQEKVDYQGITLRSGGSIGVAVFPNDGDCVSDLMINADLALYDVKKNGRGSFRFYDPGMRRVLSLRKKLEDELRCALDEKALEPFFQPQVDITENKVTGLECLVRWKHETKGYISPCEFLPVAESAGEMVRLGRQIMEKAIEQASWWFADGFDFGRLGLNASAQELREDDFSEWLIETAKRLHFPVNRLSVELLETIMVDDEELKLSSKLSTLRHAGIDVELDDFGTGYASLRQVDPKEISRLKIDRSFIQDIDLNHKNAMIVRSIVDLTKSLNMQVIAEGVETKEELDTLFEIGCDTIQGYVISRPLSAYELKTWLKNYNSFQDHNQVPRVLGSTGS